MNPLTTKQHKYANLLSTCAALADGETDWIANAANIVATVHKEMGFLWTGVYRVVGEELVLGPFQGPVACTRIKYGRGVCGSAWEQRGSILVPDVDKFPGHIRCSSEARSEVVIPIWSHGEILGVLDIDSDKVNGLDNEDLLFLTEVSYLIAE